MINIYNEDCMITMREAPDDYWDLAIVDPPYGIGWGSQKTFFGRRVGGVALQTYTKKNWDKERPNKEYFTELFRVSKNQVIWGGNFFVEHLPASRGWICWDKQMGMNNFSMHELAFTSFDKPSRIYKGRVEKNSVSNNPELAKQYLRIHPSQKPVPLYTFILSLYANKGDKILDTHLGSGSSAIAAYNAGYDFWGYEIDKDYFDKTQKRLQDHQRQQRMFV